MGAVDFIKEQYLMNTNLSIIYLPTYHHLKYVKTITCKA